MLSKMKSGQGLIPSDDEDVQSAPRRRGGGDNTDVTALRPVPGPADPPRSPTAGAGGEIEPARRWFRGARGPASVRLFSHYIRLPLVLLAVAEFLLMIGSVYLGALLLYGSIHHVPGTSGSLRAEALTFAGAVIVCMVALGLYQARQQPHRAGTVLRIMLSMFLASILLALVYYLFPPLDLGRAALGVSGLLSFIGLLLARFVFFHTVDDVMFRRRILAYGAGEHAASLTGLRTRADLRGFRIVGFVARPGDQPVVQSDRLVEVKGSLLDFVRQHDVDEIVVALDDRRKGLPVDELLACKLGGFTVSDVATFLERETGKVALSVLYPSWLIFSDGAGNSRMKNVVERVFDVVVAAIMLVVTLPFTLLAALAIWVESGFQGPVLYRQTRVGLEGKPFKLLKFRSMQVDAEKNGEAVWAQSNDPRVTRVGGVLRKYRIDELPQLINVLRGDMSIVGPRPERPEFVADLSETLPYYRERHCVRPGISGWAQLCYPYGSSQEDALEKLQYDLYYVKNRSLLFDMLILLQTAEVVIWGKGAR